ACKLPAAKERVLDWFHVGMRFQHLLIAVQGPRGTSAQMRGSIKRRIMGAKWLLWHGQRDRCLRRLGAVARATGWTREQRPRSTDSVSADLRKVSGQLCAAPGARATVHECWS